MRSAPTAHLSARRALWSVARERRLNAGAGGTRSRRIECRQRHRPCRDQGPYGIETAFADQPPRRRIAIVPADIDHIGLPGPVVMRSECGMGLRGGDIVPGIEIDEDISVMQNAVTIGTTTGGPPT